MSLLRSASRALRPICSARQFSTPAPGPTKSSSSSSLPLFFGGAGIVGLATYLYLGGSTASFSTAAAPSTKKLKPTKSALDPERFLDQKLNAVEPYNHNTSRFIFELPEERCAALFPVTSVVVVRASEGADGAPLDKANPIIRPYTPISCPEHEGELVLLIK